MKRLTNLFIFVALSFTAATYTFAQETEELVVDEVIAQVNDGVITLSRVRREVKNILVAEVQQGKNREAVQKELDEKQGELISNLINEELMLQLAKEKGLEREVEAEVNNRMREVMQQYGLSTVEELHKAMEEQGVNPQEIREAWRGQITKDMVIQRMVRMAEYWRPNSTELQEYYDKNKGKFTTPETVSFSEIFLSFAGNDENAVRQKAAALVAELRKGGDFEKIVVENSDRQGAAQNKGKINEVIEVEELDQKYAAATKGLKKGDYTDPIDQDDVGIIILRIDDRTAASSESTFNENAVRMAILREKEPEAMKKFMSELRQDAYIKLNDRYRPMVAPILYAEERKAVPQSEDN